MKTAVAGISICGAIAGLLVRFFCTGKRLKAMRSFTRKKASAVSKYPACFGWWEKNNETVNYGRLGGTLDATKHLERAIPRMCFPDEITAYCELKRPNLNGKP